MQEITQKNLSEVHGKLTLEAIMEQNITELEITSIEHEVQMTELEIEVEELKQKVEN